VRALIVDVPQPLWTSIWRYDARAGRRLGRDSPGGLHPFCPGLDVKIALLLIRCKLYSCGRATKILGRRCEECICTSAKLSAWSLFVLIVGLRLFLARQPKSFLSAA
jgi:hypothetical protein